MQVDSGTSRLILHKDFIKKDGLLVEKRKISKQVKNVNEEPISNARTHYIQPIVLVIRQHSENIV